MQTDTTLELLEGATKTLGREIRSFIAKVCSNVATHELPREAAARYRRQQAQVKTSDGPRRTSTAAQRLKTFNIRTYKFHALADYVPSIRSFGTTDSYSTQLVRV